ncbi:MAG: hypothetical protein RLZZ466_659 [Bacteroidota bacterium]|jgi:outer membrane protein OmpA-like peptidoglycan-associated protein
MRSYITLIFLLISSSLAAQSSISIQVGGSDRTLQQAASRRDVLLHYSSVGFQYARMINTSSEVFGGLNFGFQMGSTARYASAVAGMRYYLKPLSKRLIPFGQFAGELLFDNSYALTNRDADYMGSAALGIDFKTSSSIYLRGMVGIGLPFYSTGTLSPQTNSGSSVTAGIGLVFKLPTKTKVTTEEVLVQQTYVPIIAKVEAPIIAIEQNQATGSLVIKPADTLQLAVAPKQDFIPLVTITEKENQSRVNLDSLFNKEVFFKTDKSWVGPESAKKLDKIIGLLREYPQVKLHLKGHTDYRQSDEYNLKLSQKRVENVRKYLESHGVDKSRFKTEAFSELVPVSKSDLQLNRRVEIRLWRE